MFGTASISNRRTFHGCVCVRPCLRSRHVRCNLVWPGNGGTMRNRPIARTLLGAVVVMMAACDAEVQATDAGSLVQGLAVTYQQDPGADGIVSVAAEHFKTNVAQG